MIIKDSQLPAAEGGVAVSAEMLDSWVESYEAGALPEGYSFDGPVRPGRPKLIEGEMTTMTIRIPLAMKNAICKEAEDQGMTASGYVREVLSLRAV